MPEDFFAEGFGQEQGPTFTKEQNDFLQSRIAFLDPMKTYQIPMSKVLALLKYTNLDKETIMKIINNSCSTGIGQKIVTHDEMKKIFRGVALKQNKIQPSKINIDANIKTKMPVFYDDDDQSEEEEDHKPPAPNLPKKQTQPQRPPANTPQVNHPVNQPPQPPKPQQQAPVNPLKAFDEYWKTLKIKNNLIDGSQVKKMFTGNNVNKNNLSKAWKLCNISEKGVLTKGQFFIFMNLIHNPNIPETLTKQMKDLIKQIEEASGYKKASTIVTQPSTQGASSTSNLVQKRPSLDVFDKFGDESLFAKNSSKAEDLPKSGVIAKSMPNVFRGPPSILASSSILAPPPAQKIDPPMNKNPLQLLQRIETIGKQQKSHNSQLSHIVKNNQQMMQGLGSIQQYLNLVQENFKLTTGKIEVLKQTQNSLNERLNNVCLKFKNIITQQSQCIAFLMETMRADSESNTQRLQILEGYTEQMVQFVSSNLETTRNDVVNLQKQQSHAFDALKQQNQQLRQKLSAGSNLAPRSPQVQKVVQNTARDRSPQIGFESRVDPFEDNEAEGHEQQGHNHGYEEHGGSKSIDTEVEHEQPTNHFSAEENGSNQPQQSNHTFLENLSPEQRKKTKQMLLIQILNSVSSMSEQEYQAVVAKVVAMTEQQMNQSYTKLHSIYMQNVAKSGMPPKYPVPSPQQFTAPYG